MPRVTLVSLDAGATDADGDTLTYAASGLPAGLEHRHAGPVSSAAPSAFKPARAAPTTSVVTVTDVRPDATDTFSWTVTNTNRTGLRTDLGDRTDAEGDSHQPRRRRHRTPTATRSTYSASGLPGGISHQPATGVISGTLGSHQLGSYNTVITVSDGTLSDTDTFTWTVANTNRPPVFSTDLADRPTPRAARVSLDADASDPDGDSADLRRHRPARGPVHQPVDRRDLRHPGLRAPPAALQRHRHRVGRGSRDTDTSAGR